MAQEFEVPVVGRIDVDRYIVRMADGEKVECGISEALRLSRFFPTIGDRVRMHRTGPGTGLIYYRVVPVHAYPSDNFRREELVRKGILKPKGTYDERAHDPPPLDVPVCRLDHAGKKAAAARAKRGGVDTDFERAVNSRKGMR